MKCAIVALIGAPNAGKSTLINQMVGAKVSIVTHKVQTTRARVRGVAVEGETQLVLVDTPGIFAPRRMLDRAMVRTAWSEAGDADQIVLLIDAQKGVTEEVEAILSGLVKSERRALVALNKIDRIKREKLLELTQDLSARDLFDEIFMISALTGDGVSDLFGHLVAQAGAGPWLFPEDQLSDMPQRLLAAEVTREKLYLRLHQELPYASSVETLQYEERKDGSIRIDQTVFVERDSQKGIVLGKGGQTLKQIGQEAREELTDLLGQTVHLFIHVKVREGWAHEAERLREIGLDVTDLS